MAQGKFVAYYRVSSQKQGQSGLGLEAQRQAVANFLNGGNWRLLAEYTEVESGRENIWPELAKAFDACRLHQATLVIAKLDRLSRNAAFLMNLRDAGIDFVCADMPDANRMSIGILALVAEHQREAISARTKDALAAAKARGTKLGNPQGWRREHQVKGHAAGMEARVERADQRAAMLRPVIDDIRASGITTLRGIAAELNAREIPAPRGGLWASKQVTDVLRRLEAKG
jgi:DNA invertase Pin-like site-specific DNA recombinase